MNEHRIAFQIGACAGTTATITYRTVDIARLTGRRLWAVEQQIEAMRRRIERGQRYGAQLRRLFSPLPPSLVYSRASLDFHVELS